MIPLRMLLSVLMVLSASGLTACHDADPMAPEANLELEAVQDVVFEAQEPKALPFHGSTTGMLVGTAPAEPDRCPVHRPVLFTYRGEGNATHLGVFTVEGDECVNPITMSTGNARFTFTAANGDTLFVAYDETTVTFDPPPSPWMRWSSNPYLTGGSGRFQGAEFVDVKWGGGGNLATGEMYSNLDGWIRYDASRRRNN